MHLLFAVLLALTQHWLVVSDLHLNPFDRSSAPSTYKTDSNWTLVRTAIAEMRKADPNPDVVLIAGDQLAHKWGDKAHDAGRDPVAAAEDTFGQLARAFNAAFPHAQFVITMGNNDDPCGDYRTGRDSPYLKTIARTWAPLVNRHNASPNFEPTFARGGYYETRLPGNRVALVLDDVYYSFVYRACGRGSAGNDQFTWFENTLKALPKGTVALPVFHIPSGVDPFSTLLAHRFLIVSFWNNSARTRFEGDLQQYSPRIPFGITAHMHRSDFRIVGNVPLLAMSSISPVYGNNPSFMRLTFDGDGGPARLQTFVYDLTTLAWHASEPFAKIAGASRFDLAGVRRAHARIASDAATRTAWEQAMTGGSDAWYGVRDAWIAYWCAQTETGNAYISCAGDRKRTDATYAAAAAIGVAAVAAVWYSLWRWKQRRSSRA